MAQRKKPLVEGYGSGRKKGEKCMRKSGAMPPIFFLPSRVSEKILNME